MILGSIWGPPLQYVWAINIALNVILRYHIIVSAVKFHLSIHYILLNNFIWIKDVAGFVNQPLFI